MRDEASRAIFELLMGRFGKAWALHLERIVRVIDDGEESRILPQAGDGHGHGIECEHK